MFSKFFYSLAWITVFIKIHKYSAYVYSEAIYHITIATMYCRFLYIFTSYKDQHRWRSKYCRFSSVRIVLANLTLYLYPYTHAVKLRCDKFIYFKTHLKKHNKDLYIQCMRFKEDQKIFLYSATLKPPKDYKKK